MTVLGLDYETKAEKEADLKLHGLDRYSSHPDTRVLMAAYRLDKGPLRHVEIGPDQRVPAELKDALLDPHVEKWAFNAQFERVITRRVLKIATPTKGWRCTMVAAYMCSFVGGLEEVGMQIGLPADKAKMAEGRKLIRMFTMPQRVTKNQPHRWLTQRERPVEWQTFCDYNKQDVVAEEAIRDWLMPYLLHNAREAWEWHLYEIDQRINDRGKPVDPVFSQNALDMAKRRQDELLAEMREITGLPNPNSVSRLVPWLRDRGYPFADLGKDSVTKVLKNLITEAEAASTAGPDDGYVLDEDAIQVLKLRQWAARTSLRKHTTLLKAVGDSPTGPVLRFLYQFAGASRTNRWAGRRVQTQNLPRTPKNIEEYEKLFLTTEMIRDADYDSLDIYVSEIMEALVGTVRSAFRTADGYEFVVCDLASIESCVIGWLFKCERLLNVFRTGLDAYKDFATILYGIPYDQVTKKQRTDSKPAVLGAGYRLGGGDLTEDGKKTGLWGYAENMGIDLTRSESHEAVQVFRTAYKEIPKGWFALEDATSACVVNRVDQRSGYLRFKMVGDFMLMILPSGRPIYYHKPRMVQKYWIDAKTKKKTPRKKKSFTYMGQHQKTGMWTRLENHGGRFTEQAVQGIARDVLAEGIKAANARGFDIRGHVHDEIITLRAKGDIRYSLDVLQEEMTKPIRWAPGLPLGGAGWEGPIYRKD